MGTGKGEVRLGGWEAFCLWSTHPQVPAPLLHLPLPFSLLLLSGSHSREQDSRSSWAPPCCLPPFHFPLEAEGGEILGRNGEAAGAGASEAETWKTLVLGPWSRNGVKVVELS